MKKIETNLKWLNPKYLMIMLCLFVIHNLTAQQKGLAKWVFPPAASGSSLTVLDLANNTQSTLAIPPSGPHGPNANYAGQVPVNVYANMTDDNGDLLFFIIDHTIYDKDGYHIATIDRFTHDFSNPYSGPVGHPTVNPNFNVDHRIGSEINIVNVPGECNKYYIIYTYEETDGGLRNGFFYLTLDMGRENVWYPGRMGRLEGIHEYAAVLPPNPWAHPNGPDQIYARPIKLDVSSKSYKGGLSVLFTQPKNGKRFMYITGTAFIERYVVDKNGITYDNYDLSDFLWPGSPGLSTNNIAFFEQIGNGVLIDSDIHLLNNGNYRLAFAGRPGTWAGDINNWVGINNILGIVATIDGNTGDLIDYSGIEYTTTEPDVDHISGMEFSHDGNILYLSSFVSPYLHYINFSIQQPINDLYQPIVFNAQTLINSQFKEGNIERGMYNELFFVKATGLGKLSNSNNPGSNWDPDAVVLDIPKVGSQTSLFWGSFNQGYIIPQSNNNEDYNHTNLHTGNTIIIDPEPLTFCTPESYETVTIAGQNMNFTNPLWSNGTSDLSATYEVDFGNNEIYVDVINEWGCVERISRNIFIGANVDLNLSPSTTSYCPKLGLPIINYTAQFNDPTNSAATATWTKDGVFYSSDISNITADGPGEYCLEITESNFPNCRSPKVCTTITAAPCSDVDPTFNHVEYVDNVNNTFTVEVSDDDPSSSNWDEACMTHTWTLSEQVNGQWVVRRHENFASGLFNYTLNKGTHFKIDHTTFSTCTDFQTYSSTGFARKKKPIKIDEKPTEIMIYPNPTTNQLFVTGNENFNTYQVIDITGKVVANGSYTDQFVETTDFKNGLYQINFLNQNFEVIESKKFVKTK